MLQTFKQRVYNYLHYFDLEKLVQAISKDQAAFAKLTGLRLPFQEKGKATSAATITVTDFAIEYPSPMPPRMHVSFVNLQQMQLICCNMHAVADASENVCGLSTCDRSVRANKEQMSECHSMHAS